ncbi:MAG: peptidyl-prolyl cis-trans isomerase [Polyangiaceae bacterium]|nr:peptidyl-prolyl cis-trans isomerase [Polyangiaceae bacterium]
MRVPSRSPSTWRLLVVASLAPGLSAAADDVPCVRVGPLTASARAIEERLAELPEFQRRSLAPLAEDIPHRFLDTVLVPELLLAAEARRRGLGDSPMAADAIRETLRRALVDDLRRELAAKNPVTAADIERYYTSNRERFERPQRLRVWRILVDDDAAARAVLAAARGVDGPRRWSELARERSRDKATAMRKGELGFIYPDGRTDVPTVRVDPALFAAAAEVRDGELVPEPVPEGKYLAVVWRRGTLPATHPPRSEVDPIIRGALERERLDREVRRLITSLRTKHLELGDPAALELVPSLPQPEAPALPPPVLSVVAPQTSGGPQPTDRGLR